MRQTAFAIAILIMATGCSVKQTPTPQPTSEETIMAFMGNFTPYCGQTFRGKSTFIDLGEDHPLEDAELTMIVQHCSEDEIRIPFHVRDDRSRTWILTRTPDGLRLAHDHRYEDGTEYEANFYGGIAMDNNGAFEHYPRELHPSESILFYPADQLTLADRPAREINVWSTEFDHKEQKYFYRLYLYGELRYEAEFYLAYPVSEHPHGVNPDDQ